MNEPIQTLPLSRILVNRAAAVQEIAEELPAAVRKGPQEVAEVLMNEERRGYVGLALAALALILLLFGD